MMDDGHTMITIAHHEPMAQVNLKNKQSYPAAKSCPLSPNCKIISHSLSFIIRNEHHFDETKACVTSKLDQCKVPSIRPKLIQTKYQFLKKEINMMSQEKIGE